MSVLLARHQILNLGGNRRGANLDETLVGVVSKATNERRRQIIMKCSNRSSVKHKPPLATCDSAKKVVIRDTGWILDFDTMILGPILAFLTE